MPMLRVMCASHKPKPKPFVEHTCGKRDIRNSGYYRLLMSDSPPHDAYDDVKKEIAQLVSKIHATSITNGNMLETGYVGNPMYNYNFPLWSKKSLSGIHQLIEGHYSRTRFYITETRKTVEVDYTTVETVGEDLIIRLFEIKDGGELDTKKALAEVGSLLAVRDMLYNNTTKTRVVIEAYVVLWNTDTITQKSFKSSLNGVNLITGREMCHLVGGIDFDNISKERTDIGPDNLSYIIRQFRYILFMYEMISEQQEKCHKN